MLLWRFQIGMKAESIQASLGDYGLLEDEYTRSALLCAASSELCPRRTITRTTVKPAALVRNTAKTIGITQFAMRCFERARTLCLLQEQVTRRL